MEAQIVYVDEQNRILGPATELYGTEVFTEFNLAFPFTEDRIPKYKYINGEVIERTEAEIQADRESRPLPEPTEMERLRADVDYLLMIEE